MKKEQSIRLFFIFSAVCVFAVFWIGFRFGQNTQEKKDMRYFSEIELEQANSDIGNTDGQTASADAYTAQNKKEGSVSSEKNTDDDTKNIKNPEFYLKQNGEYLTVYVSATDEIYFETDIPVKTLPTQLREEAEAGIDFYDLEDLYSFLENYSS